EGPVAAGNKDEVPGGGICREDPAVDLVDGCKMRGVVAVERTLHDLAERGPRHLQALLHLLDDDLHLLRHRKFPHLPGKTIVGWHLRNIDEASMGDDKTDRYLAPLGVGCERLDSEDLLRHGDKAPALNRATH